MSSKPARAGFYPRLGVASPFDAHYDLVTSPVFSPLVLAIIRLTLGTYALFVAFYQLAYEALADDGTVNGCVHASSLCAVPRARSSRPNSGH